MFFDFFFLYYFSLFINTLINRLKKCILVKYIYISLTVCFLRLDELILHFFSAINL